MEKKKLKTTHRRKLSWLRKQSKKQIRKILKQAMDYNDGPCLIHAEVVKQDNVFPMIPAGGAASDMILERPKLKMEKPKGST